MFIKRFFKENEFYIASGFMIVILSTYVIFNSLSQKKALTKIKELKAENTNQLISQRELFEKNTLLSRSKHTSKNISKVIASTLEYVQDYNLQKSGIEQYLTPFLDAKDIVGIQVNDKHSIPFASVWIDESNQVQFQSDFKLPEHFTQKSKIELTQDVLSNGKKIGTILVYFNQESLLKEIQNSKKMLKQAHAKEIHEISNYFESISTLHTLIFMFIIFFIIYSTYRLIKSYHLIKLQSKKLEDYNHTLEDKVKNRTEELAKQTVELQKSNSELVVLMDEREKTQQEKELMTQKLVSTSKLASLGEMAAGIAHEINNPLAIISAKTRIIELSLAKENINNKIVNDGIESINKTTKRIGSIINGLKEFSKNEKLETSNIVEVSKLIDETLSLCREKFKNNGVDISILEIPENTNLTVLGNKVQFSQIILNLLNNSFDAIKKLETKWIKIGIHEEIKDDKSFTVIQVTDSGGGLPTEVQEKVMNPFFTTKELGKGTGLGLSISFGIAKKYGGSLIYTENKGHTSFKLYLVPSNNK